MNIIMLHTHNDGLAVFKLRQAFNSRPDRRKRSDHYPTLDIKAGDVDLTIFPSYEQLRELHILIGQFMLEHPEAYDKEEVVNAD